MRICCTTATPPTASRHFNWNQLHGERAAWAAKPQPANDSTHLGAAHPQLTAARLQKLPLRPKAKLGDRFGLPSCGELLENLRDSPEGGSLGDFFEGAQVASTHRVCVAVLSCFLQGKHFLFGLSEQEMRSRLPLLPGSL